MGVPVVTLLGDRHSARVSASLLNAAELPELVTYTLGDYEALALRLAREPELLKRFKDRLKNSRATAPLFDGDLFRRNMEAAFIAMRT
jgi:predicted O-linked N-acetylglucosamine transferase (SPINDLY family)